MILEEIISEGNSFYFIGTDEQVFEQKIAAYKNDSNFRSYLDKKDPIYSEVMRYHLSKR